MFELSHVPGARSLARHAVIERIGGSHEAGRIKAPSAASHDSLATDRDTRSTPIKGELS